MLLPVSSAATIEFVGVTPDSPSCPTICAAQGYNVAWDATGILLPFSKQSDLFFLRNLRIHRTNRVLAEARRGLRPMRDILRIC